MLSKNCFRKTHLLHGACCACSSRGAARRFGVFRKRTSRTRRASDAAKTTARAARAAGAGAGWCVQAQAPAALALVAAAAALSATLASSAAAAGARPWAVAGCVRRGSSFRLASTSRTL
eukprot:95121-Chlamydomonas_euryale.AAC.4